MTRTEGPTLGLGRESRHSDSDRRAGTRTRTGEPERNLAASRRQGWPRPRGARGSSQSWSPGAARPRSGSFVRAWTECGHSTGLPPARRAAPRCESYTTYLCSLVASRRRADGPESRNGTGSPSRLEPGAAAPAPRSTDRARRGAPPRSLFSAPLGWPTRSASFRVRAASSASRFDRSFDQHRFSTFLVQHPSGVRSETRHSQPSEGFGELEISQAVEMGSRLARSSFPSLLGNRDPPMKGRECTVKRESRIVRPAPAQPRHARSPGAATHPPTPGTNRLISFDPALEMLTPRAAGPPAARQGCTGR